MQYRFTQMAANVMHYSKEVAAELNHSYIGTEHILIGVLRGTGMPGAGRS